MMKHKASVLSALLIFLQLTSYSQPQKELLSHETKTYGVELAADKPEFVSFWVDSMGNGRQWTNGMLSEQSERAYSVTSIDGWIRYVEAQKGSYTSFKFEDNGIVIKSSASKGYPAEPFKMIFRIRGKQPSHATLLGVIDNDNSVKLPAVLHIPGQGTLRITADSKSETPLYLGYNATREQVTITFPAGTPTKTQVQIKLEVISLYPELPEIKDDPRFEGYRRCWLNILQLSSKHGVLANHAGSDVAGLCYHEYSEIAMLTGALADGVSGPQLLRDSLNCILAGKKTYGMPGYVQSDSKYPYASLDTWPSLLIAAHSYYLASKDEAWAKTHIDKLLEWGHESLKTDSNGNGLIEFHQSGNLGECEVRPANWWDCINYGHEDAYSNALAYRAFRGLAQLADVAGKKKEAQIFDDAAKRLKAAYYPALYNKKTGLLAGWKSRDGQLHDYAFMYIQGMAIMYGLVDDKDKANGLLDAILAKLDEVGYDRFDLGLPGNLINVPKEDYYEEKTRWGGSNAFENYENGGASANHVYFTLAALYMLGRQADADKILFPILKSFNECSFQGEGENGKMTNDWRTWDGTPWGYEGLLSDNYLVVKAVLVRQGKVDPIWGYWSDR